MLRGQLYGESLGIHPCSAGSFMGRAWEYSRAPRAALWGEPGNTPVLRGQLYGESLGILPCSAGSFMGRAWEYSRAPRAALWGEPGNTPVLRGQLYGVELFAQGLCCICEACETLPGGPQSPSPVSAKAPVLSLREVRKAPSVPAPCLMPPPL